MHSGDHHDVHLVCTRTILSPQHFLHYMDTCAAPTYDQRFSPPESKLLATTLCLKIIHSCSTTIRYIIREFSPILQVNAGILAPGLMGLYVVFICWCAIRRHDFLSFRHFLFNVFDNLLGISTNKYAHAVDIFLHLGLLMKIGCPQTLRLVNKAFVVVVFVFVVVVLFFLLLYMFRAFCGDGEIV